MKVLVLGASGMLGSAVLKHFNQSELEVLATVRHLPELRLKGVGYSIFDAESGAIDELVLGLEPGDFIINCIGIIKSEIDEADAKSRASAVAINSQFPRRLAAFAERNDLKVIQIATDCVFSGRQGSYTEKSQHDPVDLYGITKSQGEVASRCIMHLRVSIIGRELRGFTSLYEWVARQPFGSHIRGYTNHYWNGIPTIVFARICHAIISKNLFQAGVHHVLPLDILNKAQLVRLIAAKERREDIEITDFETDSPVDRSLATISDVNEALWHAAGYLERPSIASLVSEI
jgi:dTDP-4-dehydrorhamnose reductase